MSDKKQPKSFKIINKSKEGLVIILYGKKVDLTWDEFKADYVMDKGRMTCHFNNRAQERLDKASSLIDEGVAATLAINSPKAAEDPQWKLTNVTILGNVSSQLQDLLGLSLPEIADLISQRISLMKKGSNKPAKKEKKTQKKVDVESQKEERHFGSTVTLGDLPAMQELKKKYGL